MDNMEATIDEYIDLILPPGLNGEERQRCRAFIKNLPQKCVVTVLTHPIELSKILWRFGYEPYALATGRSFWVIGSYGYYLPNVFKYISNTYYDRGLKVLFKGADSNLACHMTYGITHFVTSMYIDRFYPEIGGDLIELDVNQPLTDYERFRSVVRLAIRDSVAVTIATIIARPFTVIMIREVVQLIGNESKYSNVLQSLFSIGNEEGPAGLFSGLIPQLICSWTLVWGNSLLSYAYESLLENHVRPQIEDEDAVLQRAADNANSTLKLGISLIVSGISYPFQLVSSIMSVTGSGLLVSMMPCASTLMYWQDYRDYLRSHKALDRGSKILFRRYKGAIKVDRSNGAIYAISGF